MKKIHELILSKSPKTVPDYLNLYKMIEREISNRPIENKKIIRIALLTSFTSKGLKEILTVKCCKNGIFPEVYVGPYNQYNQEILNPSSFLYQFKPDLVILFIDSRTILDTKFLLPYEISDVQRKEETDSTAQNLISLVRTLQHNCAAKIIIHNFEIPVFSPLGILENKQDFGFIESVEYLNKKIRDAFKKDSQIFIFDYNAFCSKLGKQNSINYKLYYLADLKLNLEYIPFLADEYLSYIKPMVSLTKKCIVLDLDNTLWGGIIGEDGIEGIHLGPTPEGRPYWEFQAHLLSLFNRGVILAINSKNNPEDALAVLRNHPYMILKEKHFASIRINWNDKISNMIDIANEINIGLESMVFIDDDKLNREIIKKELPEVLVIEMPDDPTLFINTMTALNDFNALQITDEDLTKGKMYADQRQRSEFQKTVRDLSEYFKGLEMVVTIEKANPFTIPRISQLTQKTNQFNLTTRRYLEEDIKKFATDENFLIVSVDVKDKFGDNGTTGVAIVKAGAEEWHIDTLLMSCRIIGRRIEDTLLEYIINEVKSKGAKRIAGEFIPTKKNKPAKDFFRLNGFVLKKTDESGELWEYDLNNAYKAPDYIRVITR